MRHKKLNCLAFSLCFSCALFAQEAEREVAFNNYHHYYEAAKQVKNPEKEASMESFRKYFSKKAYRPTGNYMQRYVENDKRLSSDGTFSDLDNTNIGKPIDGNAAAGGSTVVEAFNRVWHISEAFRDGLLSVKRNKDLWDRCQKAILYYGKMEIERPNEFARFHSSCFAIPTAAVNIYFCHLAQMDAVEQGAMKDNAQLTATCDMLKTLGLQAWTQPFRKDQTDENVVQIERFRNHVWWVGGNALGYRSLLPVAFMYRSIPMVDVLSEVCRRGISSTSQNTYKESFWTEGFTADGAGWGHGMQCLIWGYPIDGTMNALNMLSMLKKSPWEQKLDKENTQALLNYFRGSNFYYYKGYNLPCLDRYSMTYKPKSFPIRYQAMLKQVVDQWNDSFTPEEQQELKQLYSETQKIAVSMEQNKAYNGTRWFFNNDDLIKKNKQYHIIVNMASVRCDGIESAHSFADAYNFYTADGATLFQKSGNEYNKAIGAFDVTAFPGVTAREGMTQLTPVTNWRGYCSKHNFAAAATTGGENAVAGFIFEKMDASTKEGVNDRSGNNKKNQVLYGVKAHKSYFMLGDYMVALGAGITNLTPQIAGNIRTTIDQTEQTGKVSVVKGNGIEWIVQRGKFAYSAFPEYKQRLHYVCETKATDWQSMNSSNKSINFLPESVDMLQIWIDHGATPINDTYGYAVYAGEGAPANEYPFQVLRNDTLIQAVKSIDSQTIQAVFYNPQTVLEAKDLSLSVSAPCAVMIEKQENGKMVISVTDARMEKSCTKIDVILNGKTFSCDMPQGSLCGKPAVKVIES